MSTVQSRVTLRMRLSCSMLWLASIPTTRCRFRRRRSPFLRAALQPRAPMRVVWSPDLGISPLHPEVRATCERALAKFPTIAVETRCPDFSQAEQTFQVLRNMQRVGGTMELLDRYRDKLSPEIIHYSTRGLSHTAREIALAELARGELYRRMAALFETCDLLITPTVMVPALRLSTASCDGSGRREVAGFLCVAAAYVGDYGDLVPGNFDPVRIYRRTGFPSACSSWGSRVERLRCSRMRRSSRQSFRMLACFLLILAQAHCPDASIIAAGTRRAT